jgi:hypothetical protein
MKFHGLNCFWGWPGLRYWANRLCCFVLLCFLGLLVTMGEDFQGASHQLAYEGDPVKYNDRVPADAVARLENRLKTGEVVLEFDDQFGYLPALLKELKISPSSQMLVFSKTSLQRRLISPENPRAIYFNDDAYVAYIPGAPTLEISTADPKLGGVFYRLDNQKFERPKFSREQDCLSCHGAQRTLGVPGHFVRSIGTDSSGELDSQSEIKEIDQTTPIKDRWAGWFLTGQHGGQVHRGNLVGEEAFKRAAKEPNYLGNLTNLGAFFEAKKHLRPTSDITALLVLEHQVKMHNYITRLNFETQLSVAMYGHTRYLKNQVNAFLRYLLFTEEAPLSERIVGDAEYAAWFASLGPFDSKGRSLRDFDLGKRLFKYPCSFLIYSEQFDAMPDLIRQHILQRLHAILTGVDADPQFAKISVEDRRAILEILRETKTNLPNCWRE